MKSQNSLHNRFLKAAFDVISTADQLSPSPCVGRGKGVRYCAGALAVHRTILNLGRKAQAKCFLAKLRVTRSSTAIRREATKARLLDAPVAGLIAINDALPPRDRKFKRLALKNRARLIALVKRRRPYIG